jgi:hypothetical protein
MPNLVENEQSDLLGHLRQCIKSVMVSQMEKKQLRKSLLCSRRRAEVMHLITQLGDNIAVMLTKKPVLQSEWGQLRDAFMLMLEN